jgi:hypothetical protein
MQEAGELTIYPGQLIKRWWTFSIGMKVIKIPLHPLLAAETQPK